MTRFFDRRAGIVAALVAIGGAAWVAHWIYPTFTGGGADMANHYALVYWIYHRWSLPPGNDPALLSMAKYPPGSHVLAALVGHVFGSPYRGLQLVAIAALVALWGAIVLLLLMLPIRRAAAALVGLGILFVLDVQHGPLRLEVHGYEIVGNFFFAQLVGQAIVWWLVWYCGRRLLHGRDWVRPVVALAVAAILSTWIHVLASVELVVLQACICIAEAVTRRREGTRGLRDYRLLAIATPVTALAVVITPGFRAMQSISANNGSLDVPYISGYDGYLVVAAIVVAASLATLAVGLRPARDVSTQIVLRMLAFTGISIAVPCLAQAVALELGSGSQYAVKKYIYGMLTVLVLEAVVLLSLLVRATSTAPRVELTWGAAAVIAFVAAATFSALSHRGADYSVGRMIGLERAVAANVSIDRLADGHAYAAGLPPADPVLDYMFSIAVLRTPMRAAATGVLSGDPTQLTNATAVLTSVSSAYNTGSCRLDPADLGLVVVSTRCAARRATQCQADNVLTSTGYMLDPRLQGFSRPDPTGRWTDGSSASFTCTLARRHSGPITVSINAVAFVTAKAPRQRVTLRVGDRTLHHTYTLSAPTASLRMLVPRLDGRRLRLTLDLPDAISPSSVGFNGDPRVLALHISDISIR